MRTDVLVRRGIPGLKVLINAFVRGSRRSQQRRIRRRQNSNYFWAGCVGALIGKPLTAAQQRIRQLEAENRQLRGYVGIKKKHRPSLPGHFDEHRLVEQLPLKAEAVNQICRVPGVSRSGHYAARSRDIRTAAASTSAAHQALLSQHGLVGSISKSR